VPRTITSHRQMDHIAASNSSRADTAAANHICAMERRTKLRWEEWEPIPEAIVAVNRSMELYEKTS
jgi:hypothetical protein